MSQAEDNKAIWGCVSAVVVALIGGLVTLVVNDKIPLFSPTPTFTPTATEVVLIDPPTLTPVPAPDSSTTIVLAPLPSNYGCPADARAGWMQYRDTWYYGPSLGAWGAYQLRYDLNYFYLYDPSQLNPSTGGNVFPISYSSANRNIWQQLSISPFWICIDQAGNVFSVYAGSG